jgi:hypothetical protein
MSLGWLLAGALLLGQSSAAENAAAGADSRAEVRRLVRRLDAAQLAEREAAEQQLIGMGPAILDDLPSAGSGMSPEVRQRLERIRRVLERRQAKSTAQPARVTLHARAQPIADMLRELDRQSGNPIDDTRAPENKPISVQWTDVPFWQALDQALDQAGLDLYPYAQRRVLTIVPRTVADYRRSARAAYCGPFRIEPTTIDARRNLRNPSSAALQLTLEVSWEPRIRPINLTQRLADVAAVDERGQPLTTGRASGELEATIQAHDLAKEFQLSLPLPSRAVQQIAVLKGRFKALLAGQEEAFRFGNLSTAANVEQRVAGATVVLEGVRRGAGTWEVRIQVRFERTAGALESYRGWIFLNQAWLESRDGKRIAFRSQETTRQTENEIGLAYTFDAPEALDGYQFVYRTPVSILTEKFDYEFRGLPLP